MHSLSVRPFWRTDELVRGNKGSHRRDRRKARTVTLQCVVKVATRFVMSLILAPNPYPVPRTGSGPWPWIMDAITTTDRIRFLNSVVSHQSESLHVTLSYDQRALIGSCCLLFLIDSMDVDRNVASLCSTGICGGGVHWTVCSTCHSSRRRLLLNPL